MFTYTYTYIRMKMKNNTAKLMEHIYYTKNNAEREMYRTKCLD